ncbi:hypothetical protein [Rhodoflexus caldus]|uniref:hypothetical protein n=1 Tax=Rhodoflexus caldus TaxID=2891236 RepID=UPI00202AB5BA|nr:hypothetical protein [Rhodoflexus caldus]
MKRRRQPLSELPLLSSLYWRLLFLPSHAQVSRPSCLIIGHMVLKVVIRQISYTPFNGSNQVGKYNTITD